MYYAQLDLVTVVLVRTNGYCLNKRQPFTERGGNQAARRPSATRFIMSLVITQAGLAVTTCAMHVPGLKVQLILTADINHVRGVVYNTLSSLSA